MENEIDVLDREQGDFATLEIFQENLSKTLQELQKSRRFGLLKDITEIDIKGGAIPYDERFTDIQAEVRTITKYDQLTRKIFDTPNPIPAYRLLLIHSLYDAIRDDITWLDKEIEALDKKD